MCKSRLDDRGLCCHRLLLRRVHHYDESIELRTDSLCKAAAHPAHTPSPDFDLCVVVCVTVCVCLSASLSLCVRSYTSKKIGNAVARRQATDPQSGFWIIFSQANADIPCGKVHIWAPGRWVACLISYRIMYSLPHTHTHTNSYLRQNTPCCRGVCGVYKDTVTQIHTHTHTHSLSLSHAHTHTHVTLLAHDLAQVPEVCAITRDIALDVRPSIATSRKERDTILISTIIIGLPPPQLLRSMTTHCSPTTHCSLTHSLHTALCPCPNIPALRRAHHPPTHLPSPFCAYTQTSEQ